MPRDRIAAVADDKHVDVADTVTPAPQAAGNQWGNGAISNAEWTGVRLREVLRAAGMKDSAKFTGHHGADSHLSAQGPAIPSC